MAPLVTNLNRLVSEYCRIYRPFFRRKIKVSGQGNLVSVHVDHSAIDNIFLVRLHVTAELILAVKVAATTAHVAVETSLDLVGTLVLRQV